VQSCPPADRIGIGCRTAEALLTSRQYRAGFHVLLHCETACGARAHGSYQCERWLGSDQSRLRRLGSRLHPCATVSGPQPQLTRDTEGCCAQLRARAFQQQQRKRRRDGDRRACDRARVATSTIRRRLRRERASVDGHCDVRRMGVSHWVQRTGGQRNACQRGLVDSIQRLIMLDGRARSRSGYVR